MGNFGYKQGIVKKVLDLPGYYVWDTSIIKVDNEYYMFSSAWPEEYGFGYNWLFNSKIILSKSKNPDGPFTFVKEILPRRGRQYFDGMNTHNTCIKKYKDKFYLYYMGTTYNYDVPTHMNQITPEMADSVWEHKRIGLAISDKVDGEYIRFDKPILEARPGKWDATAITNPSVVIHENGETYMLYKSRADMNHTSPMKLGIAFAAQPKGKYERLVNEPVCQLKNMNMSMEDPFIWYDSKKKKYCAIIKNCEEKGGILEQYGDLFYAESNDCMNFDVDTKDCLVASRDVTWEDGRKMKLCNLERPSILFDDNGEPEYLYCASGDGKAPYAFEGRTFIVCVKLIKK